MRSIVLPMGTNCCKKPAGKGRRRSGWRDDQAHAQAAKISGVHGIARKAQRSRAQAPAAQSQDYQRRRHRNAGRRLAAPVTPPAIPPFALPLRLPNETTNGGSAETQSPGGDPPGRKGSQANGASDAHQPRKSAQEDRCYRRGIGGCTRKRKHERAARRNVNRGR